MNTKTKTKNKLALVEASPELAPPNVEARVDGRRVVIEAQDEIVLCCGRSMITMQRNGRILIKGDYVETRATGTNRIKGGSVQVN